MVGGHSDKKYVNDLFADKTENLQVTGRLYFDEALTYFDEATIFVNTSAPGGDGFPNTYIQSWLRGVPVISFGLIPNVIKNHTLGFTVQNIDEAEKKIQEMLLNQPGYCQLSKSIKEYAERNHSLEQMTDNFIKYIQPGQPVF